MRVIPFLFCIVFCFSCSKKYGATEPPAYIKEAYLEQEHNRSLPPPIQDVDEVQADEFFVFLEESTVDPAWEQQPYETVEEWLERMEEMILLGQEEVADLELGIDKQHSRMQQNVAQINHLLSMNAKMERMQEEASQGQGRSYNFTALRESLPFTIHFVEPGDTLYSIAMYYYNSADMVDDIVAWNQGWVRNPDDLVAGVTLVLFFKNQEDASSEVVQKYLRQVEQG